MTATPVKPTDKAIKSYNEQLKAAEAQGALHEGNVRQAFQSNDYQAQFAAWINRANSGYWADKTSATQIVIGSSTLRLDTLHAHNWLTSKQLP